MLTPGMAKAFEDQRRSADIAALSFEERIGLMVDREAVERGSFSRTGAHTE